MEKADRSAKTPTSSASCWTPRGTTPHSAVGTPRTSRAPIGTTTTTTPSSAVSRLRALQSRVPPSTPTTPLCTRTGGTTVTPRQHNASSGPLVKRLRKENDSQKTESSSNSSGLQPSKSTRDLTSGKKEEVKKRDKLRKILSSNALNVPTPARRSGPAFKGLSSDSKVSAPARSSTGRSSLPSNTPSSTTTRRSSVSKARVSSHGQIGGCVSLTPEVLSKSARYSSSPGGDVPYGRAESTSVSVGVRVRPYNMREQKYPEVKSTLEVLGNSIKVTHDGGTTHSFAFDHCFWSCEGHHSQNASQEDVYNALARPLLEKAYEGYNTCLFAYGQTGSGKSYTMLGEDCHSITGLTVAATAGVIPRFCSDLIDRAHSLHAQNPPQGQLPQCQVEIELSYIEIYNERIYDLLGSGAQGGSREALRVREDPQTGPYVEGVACHTVSSLDHLLTWLMLGNKERSIAATGFNDKSSRSHAVFTLRLTQTQTEDVEGEELESSKVSVINLVDLAGSERVAATQSQGDRLKEGVCINKSLLTLGKVITALAESEGRRRPFIPYRESVLTYLLKESLGGNSRTAMIATVSPCAMNIEETLSTLRYAQQTRKIINRNYVNEDPTAVIIRSLKEEVERLRLQQLAKVSLFFDGEEDPGEENVHDQGDEGDRDRILLEKDKAILEKEREMSQAIEDKEKEIALLQDQLKCQQLLNERTKTLEQRLKETEQQQQQALETLHRLGVAKENEKVPVLINLNEDPQLSETLSYRLKDGTTCIGSSHCDLILSGLHTEETHCSIFNDKGRLKLFPRPCADTYINGKLVQAPVTLTHNDRLVLAGIYFFRVSIPGQERYSAATARNPDFYFMKEELLKEQEKRLQKEAEEALARSKAEMEREMQEHKEQLLCDMQEAHSQLVEKQKQVCELEGTQMKLEVEKRLLEEQIMRERQNTRSLELSPTPPGLPHSNFLQEVEAVLNESIQEVRRDSTNVISPMLSFRIKEANQICQKLKKPYEFMIQEVLNETGLEMVVVVKDLHHQMTATLTPSDFIDTLQLIRGSVQAEEIDAVLEEELCWERSEDVTSVPGFLNRLLDCPSLQNYSINSSITASTSFLSLANVSRKKSEHFGRRGSLGGEGRSHVAVAAAVHQALEALPVSHLHTPPLTAAFTSLSELYVNTQHVKDHTTEPGYTLSDKEICKILIQLLCHSQSTVSNVSAVATCEHVFRSKRAEELQEKLKRSLTKLSSCTSRLFQGMKMETESLVEEACSTLLTLMHSLVLDMAQLALLTPLPMPDPPLFTPGGLLMTKFTDGLRSGLDSLVKQCGETVSKATTSLASSRSQDSDSLLAAALSASTAIAASLRRFAQLNATLEHEPNLTLKEQRVRVVHWVDRIESAAETLTNMETAFTEVINYIKLSHKENVTEATFTSATKELMKRLQNLLAFTHLGHYTEEDHSLSFLADPGNSKQFMDSLQSDCDHSIQAVEKLAKTFNMRKFSDSDHPQKSVIRCKEKVLAQWPRNSNEFQRYLELSSQLKKSPYKSALRSLAGSHGEEHDKRVRFNVSCGSSTPVNSSIDSISK